MNIKNFNTLIQLVYSHKSFDNIEDIRSAVRTLSGGDNMDTEDPSAKDSAIDRVAKWLGIDRIEAEKIFDINDYVDVMMAKGVCGIDLAISIVGILEAFRDTGHLSWGFSISHGPREKISA